MSETRANPDAESTPVDLECETPSGDYAPSRRRTLEHSLERAGTGGEPS